MDLGTKSATIPTHETARCFGCAASLQYADKTKRKKLFSLNIIIHFIKNIYRAGFTPVEIFQHHLSFNLQQRGSQYQRHILFKYTNEISHCEVNEQVYQNILKEICIDYFNR